MSSNAVSVKLDAHNFSSAKGKFPPAGQDHLALPVAGKVTVVLMWAAGSPPCKESIPHLNALKQEFLKPDGDSDLVVVAISEDNEDDVGSVATLMGNNINNLDYLLCLRAGGRMPKFADQHIEDVPSVFLFSKDGLLIFPGGHPLDPEFELKVRSELKTLAGAKSNRRAVFLEATNVPQMDKLGFGKSDPFCAIFVRRKSDNAKGKNWAMCPLSPLLRTTARRGPKAAVQKQMASNTIENLLMTTEVLRDCSNPVWSNPAFLDAADFGESLDNWEVLLAVYDHVRCPAPARCAI